MACLGLILSLWSARVEAITALSFEESAQVQKLASGEKLYTLSVKNAADQRTKIQKIKIRLDAQGKISHFRIDWTGEENIRGGNMILKRPIDANYRRLLEAMKAQGAGGGEFLTAAGHSKDENFRVRTAQDLVSSLPFAVSRAEREELLNDWNGFYFGYETVDAAKLDSKEKSEELKATDVLPQILENPDFKALNQSVLADIQERATRTAHAFEAYGRGRTMANNQIVLEGFPDAPPAQQLPWPNYIEEGVARESARLQNPNQTRQTIRLRDP